MQASIKTNPAHTPCRGHCRQADCACARAQRAYWKRQLAGAPELLELPTDYARPAVPSGRGGMVPFALPAALTQRLRYLAAGANATMFMVMVAAWQARRVLGCLGQACVAGHASTQAITCMCGSWPMSPRSSNWLIYPGIISPFSVYREWASSAGAAGALCALRRCGDWHALGQPLAPRAGGPHRLLCQLSRAAHRPVRCARWIATCVLSVPPYQGQKCV